MPFICGTSAFFTAEFGLAPEEQASSGNTAGGLKNRQTFVGLKKNGLGDFAIGTQYTPVHIAVSKTDPGQQNNMTGSVIYTGQGDTWNVYGAGTSTNGNSGAYQSRESNALTLNSEVLAGFQGHAIAIMNNTNATAIAPSGNITTGGNVNTNGWGLGLDYTWNKLFATANYQAVKQITSTTSQTAYGTSVATAGLTNGGAFQLNSAASQTAPTGQATTSQPINVQDNVAYVGATYDFGILKAYASWISRKASDTTNSAYYQKRQAEQIGVRSFVTPTVEAWASAGVGSFTPYGLNQNSAHFNAWQLGSNYWLSKRTNLYAIYGQYAQSTAQYNAQATGGSVTSGQYSNNSNSYAVGMRHTF